MNSYMFLIKKTTPNKYISAMHFSSDICTFSNFTGRLTNPSSNLIPCVFRFADCQTIESELGNTLFFSMLENTAQPDL